MDEIVTQAMAKWPNVPAAYGWLRLDRRGQWHLVDRNAPGFDESVRDAGSRLEHAAFVDFICRNYQGDEQGRWYFQNGPQRVFVDLELAPLVLRVFEAGRRVGDSEPDRDAAGAPFALVAHTGYPVSRATGGLIDAQGNVFVDTDLGPGVIHDADLAALPLEGLEDDGAPVDGPVRLRLATGEVMLQRAATDPAERFGFQRAPRG